VTLLLLFGGSTPASGSQSGTLGAANLTLTALNITGISTPASGSSVGAITIAAYSRPATGAALATLARSGQRKWRDPLNEAGAGSFILSNGDADLAACDFGNIIVFSHGNIPRWSMFVRRHDRVSRAQGEEHDQVTTVSGLGLASVLEEAVVEPEGGVEHLPFADVRYFNFASPYLDDSAWTTPVAVAEPPFPPPGLARIPLTGGWPDSTAVGIWTRAQASAALGYQHPIGTGYFRNRAGTLTVTETTEVAIFALFDDYGELWVDGLLVLDYKQPGRVRATWPAWETQQVNITLSPGDHLIAIKDTTPPFDLYSGGDLTTNNYNIGEVVVAVYRVTIVPGAVEPTLDTLLLHSNTTDWVCLDYPANPPGFTPGEVMNILLDEAQARGALIDVTRTWTDALDSAGVAWPLTADITVRVGLSYYAVCRQLTEGYLDFDFAAAALQMSLWVQRGIDRSATAQLTGSVNLGSLNHAREG
jgi:hypothetical protein